MTEKTEEQIAREKEAVQKMVGASHEFAGMTKKVFDTRDDVSRFNRDQAIPVRKPLSVKPSRCDCRSYNRPEWGGTTNEVVLDFRAYFPDEKRETVCVDACIAEEIKMLWAAGVKTEASCCGHNGKSSIACGRPNVMISDPSQAQLTHDILRMDGRTWWVSFWAGAGAQESQS